MKLQIIVTTDHNDADYLNSITRFSVADDFPVEELRTLLSKCIGKGGYNSSPSDTVANIIRGNAMSEFEIGRLFVWLSSFVTWDEGELGELVGDTGASDGLALVFVEILEPKGDEHEGQFHSIKSIEVNQII